MKTAALVLFLATLCAFPVWSQPSDLSFLSTAAPGNCGTSDNAAVSAQMLFGTGTGFGCLKTVIFPQFAVGEGWTSQRIEFLPVQAPTSGLVTGATPSFRVWIKAGSGATFTPAGSNTPVPFSTTQNGCLGLWLDNGGGALPVAQGFSFSVPSGGMDFGTLTSAARVGTCFGGTDTLLAGLAQGPVQYQVVAPNASTLSQAGLEFSYFLVSGNTSWQITVDPVDITSAKPRWTAPLFQGNGYATAFSVVNASATPQSVSIALHGEDGSSLVTPKVTPSLAPGCGCNSFNQNAVGGFYANTVAGLFGDIGTKAGTIEFTASGNIIVIVLRSVNNSLGSVPAK